MARLKDLVPSIVSSSELRFVNVWTSQRAKVETTDSEDLKTQDPDWRSKGGWNETHNVPEPSLCSYDTWHTEPWGTPLQGKFKRISHRVSKMENFLPD